jgi:murein DD-endopeptidase MepM/ murein hydrolase activator NlpD
MWLWTWLACASPDTDTAAPPASDTADTADDVPRGPLQFRFPLLEPERFNQTTGVDHDPEVHGGGAQGIYCTSYNGRMFPWCYDEHDGSDFLLAGGFEAMDATSATIVAAAPGTVVETADGNYDRCHATVDGIDCDGNPGDPNYVIVEHEGGYRTMYWHMMKDSVAVAVGDHVECGDTLGRVGSSGYSSMPHLHFELQDSAGNVIDPYAGEYSQPETWWVDQGDEDGFPGTDCAG